MQQKIENLISAVKVLKPGQACSITAEQFERFFGVTMFDNNEAKRAAETFAKKYGVKVMPHKLQEVVTFYIPEDDG